MAGESSDSGLSQIQMQALTQHFERIMKQQSDGLHERLDQMEQAQQVNSEKRGGDRRRRRENEGEQRQLRFDGIKLNIIQREE